MVLVLVRAWKYQSSPPAAVVAEWLRRWTRNPMGSPRTGSNPVGSEYFFQKYFALVSCCKCYKSMSNNCAIDVEISFLEERNKYVDVG